MKQSQAENLFNQLSSINVKGKVGYVIAYNLRKINDELREYFEFKQELFRKYGEEKNGQLIINKSSDNYLFFMKEISPLEDEEIDLNLKYLTEEDLEKCEDLNTSQYLFLMENLYDRTDL